MKTNKDSGLRLTGATAKGIKAPYLAPVLRVYGAVNQLTAGGGGTMVDGMNMNDHKF
jgi:hypothetical protein